MIKKTILPLFSGLVSAALLHSTVSAAITLGDFHSVIYTGSDLQAAGEFSAATVTLNEAALDAIFAQATFGSNTVDIRFNAIKTLRNTSYLDITDDTELTNLLNDPIGDGSPTVNMFFVDTIDSCGGFNTAIVGCAFTPGNALVVESGFAAGANGAELQAHELGHNLNLAHDTSGSPNLMSGSINGNTDLTAAQVSTILSRSIVQTDGGTGQRFIQITPIVVQASAVPEPTAAALLGLAGLLMIGRRTR